MPGRIRRHYRRLLVQGRSLFRFVDPLIVLPGLFMLSWVPVGSPFSGPYVPSFFEGLVYNAYLFACLVMFAVSVRFFLTPGRRHAVHYLIFAGLALFGLQRGLRLCDPQQRGIAAAHAGVLLYQVLLGPQPCTRRFPLSRGSHPPRIPG